jgi:flagellar biosynthetic protein FlhB
MSENDTEKQHKPTPKRLEKLKKEGTFLRAKEFSSGLSLMAGLALLMMMSGHFSTVLTRNFVSVFSHFGDVAHDEAAAHLLYKQLAVDNFLLILPVGGILCTVVFAMTFLLGGFGFSLGLLKFKAERFSPIKNLKKMFSPNHIVEVIKSIIKIFLFFGVLVFFLYKEKNELFNLSAANRVNGIVDAIQFLRAFLIWMMAPVLFLALFDMLYNFFSYHKKIKMSTQEIKDESKEAEGSPEVKRKIRERQREILRRNIQAAVPQSTVVITNPTHYSVALRYNEDKDKAPKILAKGTGPMAAEIRLLAIKNSIPIYEAPQLARAIYFTGKVGMYIHPELYMAVAIVLSYVVQLKNYQRGMGQRPTKTTDLQIPKSFHY